MVLIGEKFVAVNKNAAGAGFEIARIAFESAERLTRLNLEAAKMLLQESAASARTLATGKDFGAFNAWRDAQAQGGADRVLGYSRNVYEIAAKIGADIGELLEQRLLQSNQGILEWVEETLKSSPIGQSEPAASATKAAMANARTAIEQISKAAKQAAGFADANVRAATAATAETAKTAAK